MAEQGRSFNTVALSALKEIYGRHAPKSFRISVAAGATVQVIEGNPARHSLRLRNLSTTQDVNYGTTSAQAQSSTAAQTLMARQTDIFEMHILGYLPRADGGLQAVYHSEWDDAVFVNNPGAAAVTIEVYEVN